MQIFDSSAILLFLLLKYGVSQLIQPSHLWICLLSSNSLNRRVLLFRSPCLTNVSFPCQYQCYAFIFIAQCKTIIEKKNLEANKISQIFQWQRCYSVNLLWIQLTSIIIPLAKLLPSIYVFCYIFILSLFVFGVCDHVLTFLKEDVQN